MACDIEGLQYLVWIIFCIGACPINLLEGGGDVR
jgi:hypothetical protein